VSTTAADLELAFYERFFWQRGLEPYPVQEQAISAISAGDSVMVTVPTGTGKTVIAKAALAAAVARGQRAVYTTPLRALTEEKYRELCADFGEANVGFATGDFKVNRDAPIQVEVAEILWNRIYADRRRHAADVVVMDEGHYFNEPERGYVWEQSIIGLDPRAQLVMLSATVGNPTELLPVVLAHAAGADALIVSHRAQGAAGPRVPRGDTCIDTGEGAGHAGRRAGDRLQLLAQAVLRVGAAHQELPALHHRRGAGSEIEARCDGVLFPRRRFAKELLPLLTHGIGIHHAGILPRYQASLVEELTLERLMKLRGVDRDDRGGHQPAGQDAWCSRRCASTSRSQPRMLLTGRVPPDGRSRGPAAVRRPRPGVRRWRPRRWSGDAQGAQGSQARRPHRTTRPRSRRSTLRAPRSEAQRRGERSCHGRRRCMAEADARSARGAALADEDHRRAGPGHRPAGPHKVVLPGLALPATREAAGAGRRRLADPPALGRSRCRWLRCPRCSTSPP
jgi:hypothetical protein